MGNAVVEVRANLTYVRAKRPDFTNGLKLKPWENRETKDGQKVSTGRDVVSVLGSVTREGRIQGPFKIVPVRRDMRPELTRDGLRAISGSFQKLPVDEGGEKLFLTHVYQGDDAFYVHLHAGFDLGPGGQIDGDVNKLLLDGVDPCVPGSFSLDGKSVSMELVDGLDFTEEKAERLKWAVSKTHPIIGGPGVRHDLWRIPIGAGVLAQDVTGLIFRIVNENGDLAIKDASGYRNVFMDFEMRRRAARASEAKLREAKKALEAPTLEAIKGTDQVFRVFGEK